MRGHKAESPKLSGSLCTCTLVGDFSQVENTRIKQRMRRIGDALKANKPDSMETGMDFDDDEDFLELKEYILVGGGSELREPSGSSLVILSPLDFRTRIMILCHWGLGNAVI